MPISLFISKENTVDANKKQTLNASINRAGRLVGHETEYKNTYATVAFTKHCALAKQRLYVDDSVIALFGGILVDEKQIPWRKIIEALQHNRYEVFSEFHAQFSIIVHYKESGKTFLVSDRFSQFPLYYSLQNNELLVSSSLGSFFDCLKNKTFNEQWFYDFVLFNLPLNTVTPIKNVYRMPAGTVLCVHEGNIKQQIYAAPFKAIIPQQSDQESKEQIYALFKERFPKYYTILSGGKYSTAITAGYDSRLAALFAPQNTDLELYTYGMPACADIVESKKIAQALGLKHHDLSFSQDIIQNLPDMAEKSCLYTGGVLNILRATLQWVYKQLNTLGIEAASGGIVGDHFFRSDGTPGGNLSICATELFENPQYNVTSNPYFKVFQNKPRAEEFFDQARSYLEQRFDWSKIHLGERHLHYAMYELSPKYYGAEHELAEHYINLTSPYWDSKVRELAYNTTISSMTTNEKLHNGVFPYWKANSAFAYILNQHPIFKKLPVSGVTPNFLATGNKRIIQLGKILQKSFPYMKEKIFSSQEDPQENWSSWFGKYLLRYTLEKDPHLLVSKYVEPKELEKILFTENRENPTGENIFIGGKILTAELILRKF